MKPGSVTSWIRNEPAPPLPTGDGVHWEINCGIGWVAWLLWQGFRQTQRCFPSPNWISSIYVLYSFALCCKWTMGGSQVSQKLLERLSKLKNSWWEPIWHWATHNGHEFRSSLSWRDLRCPGFFEWQYALVVKCIVSGAKTSEFKSLLSSSLATWLLASYLIILCLSFPIFKLEIIIALTS